MHGQGTALDEALVAILDGAVIWSLIGVDAIMATEIRLAIERLEITVRFEGRKSGDPPKAKKQAKKERKLTLPQCSQEQLKSRPLPGAMTASYTQTTHGGEAGRG